MTFDLGLFPASGPGLGHVMRCYALAEEAVAQGAQVLVVLEQWVDLPWPCAVCVEEGEEERTQYQMRRGIWDGQVGGQTRGYGWYFIDDALPLCGPHHKYIYPHFGAHPIGNRATLAGPQWMPLRRKFSVRGGPHGVGWVSYKAPEDAVDRLETTTTVTRLEGIGDTHGPMVAAEFALVPPSTIAYEALALGLHVYLHRKRIRDHHVVIGDAMVAAGVARWWDHKKPIDSWDRPRGCDALGAQRILEQIL